MGWPKDPELRKARRRLEYKRNELAYVKRSKAYRKTPAGKIVDRNWRLKKHYGLSGADWDQMFATQKGLCALCRIEPIKHTDHDHKTGKVRGLLCKRCNIGLGMFRDNKVLLLQAIQYLA